MKTLCGAWVVGALVLGLVACGDDDPAEPGGLGDGPVPNFGLVDVNPNSATHDTAVSPRAYLGHASAWYFGHST
jgi:hypothetical protein